MSVHSIALRTAASFESATSRLTDTILGAVEQDLAETLKAIAADIGLSHIAYLRLSPDKSADVCLLVAVVTYSRLWQHRYFVKKYITNDPVISYGRRAVEPFDWATLPFGDPSTKAFFADALNHSVGRNGLSIPLRNRRGVVALVSFTSDLADHDWEIYKTSNMRGLQARHPAVLRGRFRPGTTVCDRLDRIGGKLRSIGAIRPRGSSPWGRSQT